MKKALSNLKRKIKDEKRSIISVFFCLYFSAVEAIGAPKASSFLFLVPFVSVVGDFVLGEPPEAITLIAGIIAIIGVALVRFAGVSESEEIDQLVDIQD